MFLESQKVGNMLITYCRKNKEEGGLAWEQLSKKSLIRIIIIIIATTSVIITLIQILTLILTTSRITYMTLSLTAGQL